MLLVVLAPITPARADIGSTPLANWHFDTPVSCTGRSGRTLYVCGGFDAVAPQANDVGSFVRLSPSGTKAARTLALGTNAVAMADDGAGGLFVAVVGTSKGVTVYSVLHQLADGSIAPAFHPTFNRNVTAIARIGGTVYIGGFFTQADGSTRGHGAAFDVGTGVLLAWNPRLGNVFVPGVTAISAGSPGTVYVGGGFTDVAGVPATGLVRLNALTGAIDTTIDISISPPGTYVTKLLTVNNTVYVVGTFTGIAGTQRRGIAAIDLATQAPTAFTVDTNSSLINDIAMLGGRLFLGGEFRSINGTLRRALAEVEPASGALLPWQAQITNVTAMASVGSTLYVAGEFTSVNGVPRPHLAALDVAGNGATVLPWNPGITDRRPRALIAVDGDVAVLGYDLAYGAQTRSRIAAFDLVTGELLPFAPRIDGAPLAVAATTSAVYMSGFFTAVNGVPRDSVAAVDPAGALLPWNPVVGGFVGDVRAAPNGVILVVANEVLLVDGTTGALRPWRMATDGHVTDLDVLGSTVYIAGTFTFIDDGRGHRYARAGLAAVDLATSDILPFAPIIGGGAIHDIRAAGSLLYLAGYFTQVGGQSRPNVAAVDRTTGAVSSFAPAVNGTVTALTVRDGAVYLAGSFNSVNGTTRTTVAAVQEGTGTTTLSFDPPIPFGRPSDLASYPDMLVASGHVSGRLHVWPEASPTGVPGPPGSPRIGLDGSRLSVEFAAPLRGGPPSSYVLDAAPAAGAPPFASLPLSGTSFTAGGVPPGLYYLSLRATNVFGTSVSSPQVAVSVGTPGCGEPPSTPAITATASFGVVTLQWTPATGVATSYMLLVGRREGASDIGALPMGAATSFSSLAPAGVYYARVVASGPCGVSAPSADVPIVVDVAAPPASPAVSAQASGSTVSVTWTPVPGAVGYRFEAGTGPLLSNLVSLPTGATSLVAPGVPPGTYYVRVIAVGTTGESSRPDEVVVIVR